VPGDLREISAQMQLAGQSGPVSLGLGETKAFDLKITVDPMKPFPWP
jgi:hypothetical protein